MNTLQQKAREYFNDELSGEPLTQDAVEEALINFAKLTNYRNLADQVLIAFEDNNEYHFHKADREWIIDAMIEFAYKIKD